jgi:2-oxoglutarate dehydrogenase E2 component (dihydrolipoamide succinyltransferase)
MAQVDLVMPKMGESIIEATILKWTKQVGDDIEMEETVLEIATDKVDSEVPAPADGKLLEIRFEEGAVVPVGEVIAVIETEPAAAGAAAPSPNGSEKKPEPKVEAPQPEVVAESVPYVPQAAPAPTSGEPRFYSPLVMSIASKEGISMAELEQVPGSGRGGRVTKKDILSYLENRDFDSAQSDSPTAPAPAPQPAAKPATPPKAAPAKAAAPAAFTEKKFNHGDRVEVVPMDRMRKMIAENMVYSKHISAHVTSFVEADVSKLWDWRNRMKGKFQELYGEKLTFTPLFVMAVVKALREHPVVNASVEGDNILFKKDINIGIAVALPNDNLIVPVIKNADHLNLAGLSARINDLAQRARANKLKPDELEGGTYTVSNVGTFGNVMGTPVILQPQVAILATGAIRKLPAVVETPEGDMIGIRQKMYLSHSYDHRIIDGSVGGRFVKAVADYLENWDPNMEI